MKACNESAVWGEIDPHKYVRLLEQLNGWLSYRLILIIAPAKSGKTELLQRWVQALSKRNDHQIAWVSLGAADNAPESFLANLASALHIKISENINISPEDKSEWSCCLDDSSIELLNALAARPGETVIILDNYHFIEAPVVHKAVELMLDYLPPQVHLVITSQTEPPLPIAHLRVRRQVVELGPKDF